MPLHTLTKGWISAWKCLQRKPHSLYCRDYLAAQPFFQIAQLAYYFLLGSRMHMQGYYRRQITFCLLISYQFGFEQGWSKVLGRLTEIMEAVTGGDLHQKLIGLDVPADQVAGEARPGVATVEDRRSMGFANMITYRWYRVRHTDR